MKFNIPTALLMMVAIFPGTPVNAQTLHSESSKEACVSQANQEFMNCLGQMPGDMAGGAAAGAVTGLIVTGATEGLAAPAIPQLMINGAVAGGMKRLGQCTFNYVADRSVCSALPNETSSSESQNNYSSEGQNNYSDPYRDQKSWMY